MSGSDDVSLFKMHGGLSDAVARNLQAQTRATARLDVPQGNGVGLVKMPLRVLDVVVNGFKIVNDFRIFSHE